MIFSPTDSRPGERLHSELLAQLADDVRQLTQPWTRTVWQERTVWYWDHNRNRKRHTRRWRTTLTYPGLLDQLRAAVNPVSVPARAMRPARVPGSRPPNATDPSSRLAEIYVEIAKWVAGLGVRPPVSLRTSTDGVGGIYTVVAPAGDWFEQALRALVGAAPTLPRRQAEQLVADVRKWWEWAARQAGWNPQELLDERGSR